MWAVETTELFDHWFHDQADALKERLLAGLNLIAEKGPNLSRPYADTVYGSKFSNMKELRVQHEGNPIRAFYAFDPVRQAIVFCAANKKGVNENRFYASMIKTADSEFEKHLKRIELEY